MIFVNLQRFVAGPCLFLSKGENCSDLRWVREVTYIFDYLLNL